MSLPAHIDWRCLVPWNGVVTDIEDPDGLHRVKVTIPGFIEKSGWVFPLTSGGGAPGRGGHIVPAVDSDVVVQFLGGDVNQPRYIAAHWGIRKDTGKEMPATMAGANAEAHKVSEWQVGPLLFTVDERDRSGEIGKRFTITDTGAGASGKVILEYDFERQAWTIEADYMVQIISGGFLRMNGLQTSLSGRLLKRVTTRQI